MRQSETLIAVAREAGCSPSTVSRVLNNCSKGFSVRPELRERILEVARRRSFKPNPYLRAMKGSRSNLVAIMDAPYFQSGVVERAKRAFVETVRGFGLRECLKYVEYEKTDSYALEFPVDAAVLFDICDKSLLSYFESNRIPYAVVNGVCGPNGVSIIADEEAGTAEAMERLISLGHTKIAYFNAKIDSGSALASHYSVILRERAYLESLASNGLQPVPGHWNGTTEPEDFLKAAMDCGASAVLCYEHSRAVYLAHAAWKLGLAIPGDFSLACFNNEFPVWAMNPPLTCVDVPGMEMGRFAAELIGKALSGSFKMEGQCLKLPETLIVRESDSPPGKTRRRLK